MVLAAAAALVVVAVFVELDDDELPHPASAITTRTSAERVAGLSRDVTSVMLTRSPRGLTRHVESVQAFALMPNEDHPIFPDGTRTFRSPIAQERRTHLCDNTPGMTHDQKRGTPAHRRPCGTANLALHGRLRRGADRLAENGPVSDVKLTLRLPDDLLTALDAHRGTAKRTTAVLAILADALSTPNGSRPKRLGREDIRRRLETRARGGSAPAQRQLLDLLAEDETRALLAEINEAEKAYQAEDEIDC